jgi:CHAT domain-containing protein
VGAAELALCRTAQRGFREALARDGDAGWRREARHRLKAAACPLDQPPPPALVGDEQERWEGLEVDRLFEKGRLEEIVRRTGEELASPVQGNRLRGQLAWMRGTAEMGLGRPGDAVRSFLVAHEAFSVAGDLPRQGAVHSLLASAYSVVGDAQASWHHRRLALGTLQRTGWRDRLEVALNALAYESFDAGLPAAALLVLDESAPPAEAPYYRRALHHLYRARALAALGEWSAADRQLSLAAQGAAATTVSPVQAVTLLLRQGETLRLLQRHEDALDVLSSAIHDLASRGEALLLAEALAARAEAHLARHDPESARHDLLQALAHLERQRATLAPLQRPALLDVSEHLAELAVRVELQLDRPAGALGALEAATARTLTERLHALPESAAAGRIVRAPAAAASRLPAGHLVLRYGVLADELLVWSVTEDVSTLLRQPVGREELRKLALTTSRTVERGGDLDAAGERLSEILLAPIAGRPLPSQLVVVPDDVLHAVPFAALHLPGGRTPLVERVEVRVVPSLALAKTTSAPPPGPAEELLSLWVADPDAPGVARLPAARKAAGEAAAAYGRAHATLLLGREATAEAVRQALQRSSLAELAVHSTSTSSFLGSRLLLSPGGLNQSGELGAADLAELPLSDLRLVVLASCDSANSRYRGSEGLGGLQWAFLAAGTDAVVATLWGVEDGAAARFTGRLHDHLRRGQRLAAAMRGAARESISAGDPWAAFVHYGGDPRLRPPTP